MLRDEVRTKVEIDADTLVDGVVRCQCERDGRPCNNKLGMLTSDCAQFYCDKCRVEVVVKKAVMGVTTENGQRYSNLQNPDKMTLLALLIDADHQAACNRARYVQMLAGLPNPS